MEKRPRAFCRTCKWLRLNIKNGGSGSVQKKPRPRTRKKTKKTGDRDSNVGNHQKKGAKMMYKNDTQININQHK